MLVAPAEEKMWEKQPSKNGNPNITNEQINIKYEQGQQRITAIKDFYNNSLELTGLELWSEC